MKYMTVMPSIHKQYADECLATIKFAKPLVIDNTKHNLGVAVSWNIGIREMLNNDCDWLILLSAAIRFGKPGGRDFVEALEQRMDHTAVEANKVFGWHLIAFSRECIERVGKFDENLPIYFGDIDYSLRIQKAYGLDGNNSTIWEKADIDVSDMGMAHGHKLAGVEDPADVRIDYFKRKWGRHPGDYQEKSYDHPFNSDLWGVDYWPEPGK